MTKSTALLERAMRLLAEVTVNAGLDDSDLLRTTAQVERVGRAVDALRMRCAAEVSRRSSRDLGREGLAARHGHRTVAGLLSSVTGISGKRADHRGRLGILVESRPQFDSLAVALGDGVVDLDAAELIASSLAPTIGRASEADIEAEVVSLVRLAATAPTDEVGLAAASARDRLDQRGLEEREQERRARRYFRIGREVDGMVPLHALLPPEEAGAVKSYFDARTSVRRGVQFSGAAPRDSGGAEAFKDDRTMDQRRADCLLELCARAAESDPDAPRAGSGTLVVTIDLAELESATGTARVDGIRQPISASSARRIACNASILPLVLGGRSQPLDLGYSRRLFSAAQRRALVERDRGCAAVGCDAPPGWTEAHHITPWSRGGPTDLENGIMLCSFHHHLVHEGRLIVETINGRTSVRRIGLVKTMRMSDVNVNVDS